MKIIKKNKEIKAQRFNELYDFFDDDTLGEYNDYVANDVTTIDYDALEEGEIPFVQIDERNIDEYLAENYLPETGVEEDVVDEAVAEEVEPDIGVPDFANVEEALRWAIANKRVVEIFYVTSGRARTRGGLSLKREIGLPKDKGGVHIHRIVEPHYLFTAKTTGKLILVSYDRSVRFIRAFRVENIYDYNFTKNRKTKKDQYFRPRARIGVERGIKTMKNINDKLVKIASDLEKEKLTESASVIKDAINTIEDLKLAQYVGAQGYWIRNRRCWDNCYRHKRTAQPNTPAQEVWMECWEEYKKSINDNKSGWEKYAEKEATMKLTLKEEKAWNKLFAQKVEERVKTGNFSTPEAIYLTIEEESNKFSNKVIDSSANLAEIADSLNENGYKEIAIKLSEVSVEMLKEAGIFNWVGEKIKDWWSGKNRVIKDLESLTNRTDMLIQNIQRIFFVNPTTPATAKGDKEIKEAQLAPGQRQAVERAYRQNYRLIIETARNMVNTLATLAAKGNKRVEMLVNSAANNLRAVVNNHDQQWSTGALNKATMLQNLQALSAASSQARQTLYSADQQVQMGEQEAATEQPGGFAGEEGGAETAVPPNVDAQIEAIKQDPNTPVIGKAVGKAGRPNLQALFDLFSSAGVPLTTENFNKIFPPKVR